MIAGKFKKIIERVSNHVRLAKLLFGNTGCVLLFSFLILSACDDGAKHSSGPTEIQIADKLFIIPADWRYWRYEYMGNGEGGKFKQLRFTLDIDTFKPIKAEYGDEITNNFHMEIRPLASEFGEKYYWTNSDPVWRDPVYKANPHNCRDIQHGNKLFELCELDKSVRINSGAYGGYSLRNTKTGDYVSMFGCSDPDNKRKVLNKVCTGRARLLDNIQIEYTYRAEHFDRAVDLDQKAREIALGLYSQSHLTKEDNQ